MCIPKLFKDKFSTIVDILNYAHSIYMHTFVNFFTLMNKHPITFNYHNYSYLYY